MASSTHQSQTVTTNDKFWESHCFPQDASSTANGWPLLVLPLAQQRFYQEFNQQQKKSQPKQQMNPKMKDTRKVHPMKNETASAPSFYNLNAFEPRRSASDHDLNRLGIDTLLKSTNGQPGYFYPTTVVCPENQIGVKGVGYSSGDSFVSAYSGGGGAQQRCTNGPLTHSPNNSGGSSNSAAPIYLPNQQTQSPFGQFNRNTPLPSPANYLPITHLHKLHRGELSINEKYRYDLSRAQLKASSRTSALLSGFAMIALVELQYMQDTPKPLLILLGVVTTLLVSVHLLALMMSTCLLPYIEANGCTQDSPHIKLKFYIELSWIFSTCIGLLLFLLEIGVIFFVKFNAIGYNLAAYITTGMLVPVLIIFIVISCLIHRNRFTHSIERVNDKVVDLQKYLNEAEAQNIPQSNSIQRNMVNAGLQGVTVVRNFNKG